VGEMKGEVMDDAELEKLVIAWKAKCVETGHPEPQALSLDNTDPVYKLYIEMVMWPYVEQGTKERSERG